MRPQTVVAKSTSRSANGATSTQYESLRRPPKLKSLEQPEKFLRNLISKANAYAQAITALEMDRESNLSVMDTMEREIHQNSEQICALSKLNDEPGNSIANNTQNNESNTNMFKVPEHNSDSVAIVNELKANPIFLNAFDVKADINKLVNDFANNMSPTAVNYMIRQLSRLALVNDIVTPLVNKSAIGASKDDFISLLDQSLRLLFPNSVSRQVEISADVDARAVLTVDGNLILDVKEKHLPKQETMLKSTLGFLSIPSTRQPLEQPRSILFDKAPATANPFTKEDEVVAHYFANIAKPIIQRFLRHDRLSKLCENRRFAYEFSRDILNRRSISELLPFLLISVGTYLSASDVELFLVDDNNTFVSFDVAGRDLVKKSNRQCGMPLFVMRNRKAVEIGYLTDDIQHFDKEIDGWADKQPFIAAPIISAIASDTVIGVLCCAGNMKAARFSDKDVELIKDMCSVLAAVIPVVGAKEIETEEKVDIKNSLNLMKNFNSTEGGDFMLEVAHLTSLVISCEYIMIYNNKTKITYKNGEDIKKHLITEVSMKSIAELSEKEVLKASPCTKVPNFASVADVRCENMIALTRRNTTLLCFNSESKEFTPEDSSNLESIISYLEIADEIAIRKAKIDEFKNASSSMKDIIQTSANSENLADLMSKVTERMKMTGYSIWKYTPLLQNFVCVLASKVPKGSIIPSDDYIFTSFIGMESEYINENIVAGNQSKFLPMNNQISGCLYAINIYKHIVVFTGETLSRDAPLIAHDFANFIHFLMIKELKNDDDFEAIDLQKSKISDAEINSRLFAAANFSEIDLVEIVLRIFRSMKVQATLSMPDPEMAKFILKCREVVNEGNRPFHNFTHAVDCVQFVYFILNKCRITNHIDQHQIIGVLFAALLHNAYHDGLSDEYHKKAQTHLSFVDADYPGESYRARNASKLIDKFFPNMNANFWGIFIPCIKATSIVRLVEMSQKIVTKMDDVANDYTYVTSFLVSMSNTANTFRSFDFAKKTANAVFEEKIKQAEFEKGRGMEPTNMLPIGSFDSVETLESAFITTVAMPAMRALTTLYPDMSDIYVQLEENKKQWENLKKLLQQKNEKKE